MDLRRVSEEIGTPAICFSLDRVRANARRIRLFLPAPHRVWFSVKSCYALPVIAVVLDEGLGVEVCSAFEYELARQAGATPERICWHALCPDDAEARQLASGAAGLVVLGTTEGARRLVAAADECVLDVMLRVSPAGTGSRYLGSSGRLGFDAVSEDLLEACSILSGCERIRVCGLHMHAHIGVQSFAAYRDSASQIARSALRVQARTGIKVTRVSLGGGLAAAPSTNLCAAEFAAIQSELRSALDRAICIDLEPGRFIVEDAGTALARVLAIHRLGGRTWCIVDLGTQALVPFEGRAFHTTPLEPQPGPAVELAVGDTLSTFSGVLNPSVMMPLPRENDVLVLTGVGSYTLSTMQRFMRGVPSVVCFEGGVLRWHRRRESAADWGRWWAGDWV